MNRGKQGYSLPIKNWLRDGSARLHGQRCSGQSPLVQQHFNQPCIDRLIDEHLRRTHNHNHVLWALMNLALWHRRFIEDRAEPRGLTTSSRRCSRASTDRFARTAGLLALVVAEPREIVRLSSGMQSAEAFLLGRGADRGAIASSWRSSGGSCCGRAR